LSKLTTHQRKARDLMQRENWDGALSELQRVLGLDGSNPTLHNQIGDVCLRKGAIEQACDHFEMAIDLYSTVGLHNNAVALCRKVVRLAPTRVEVRYNLARLRMDQGLRSDATAAFVDYLEHAQPTDDAAADALEKRCVEVVESYPDLAPVGQIVEKLETVKRPQGAYKIVQRAAQRATDSGDAAAAARLTEKMRSLRVLLENQGHAAPDAKSAPRDPSAVALSDDIPAIDLSSGGDPAEVRRFWARLATQLAAEAGHGNAAEPAPKQHPKEDRA
jgi:tetratricopeptide (TPR) repeat protein